MTTKNGITIAKVQQKLDDCQEHHTNVLVRIEKKQEKSDEKIQKILTLLTTGEGKIKRNYMIFREHINEHKKAERTFMAKTAIIVSIVTTIIMSISVFVNMR